MSHIIPTSISRHRCPDIFTRTERGTDVVAGISRQHDPFPLTLPRTIVWPRVPLRHAPSHFGVTPPPRTHCKRVRKDHATMDVNRRHLIGASAAGAVSALAMSPDAAR